MDSGRIEFDGTRFVPDRQAVCRMQHLDVVNTSGAAISIRTAGRRNGRKLWRVLPGGTTQVRLFEAGDDVSMEVVGPAAQGARIRVLGTPWFTCTAADGSYGLASLPPGPYRLEVRDAEGSQTAVRSIVLAPDTTLNLPLEVPR